MYIKDNQQQLTNSQRGIQPIKRYGYIFRPTAAECMARHFSLSYSWNGDRYIRAVDKVYHCYFHEYNVMPTIL